MTVTDREWSEVVATIHAGFRNDHEMFTQGGCFILAEMIHDRTGWPMYGFDDGFEDEPSAHVFVIMPNGMCVDIDGICTQEEMCGNWDYNDVLPFPDGYDFLGEGWGHIIDVDIVVARAEEIVDEIIKEAKTYG